MAENQRDQLGSERRRAAFAVCSVRAPRSADGKDAATPAPRGGATLTQVASGDVYLIGGANREAQSFGDVFRLDLATSTWSCIAASGEKFPSRSGHSAVAVGDRIVVFGGMNAAECVMYEDVFVLDTRRQQWTKPLIEGWMPGARNAHGAIRLPARDSHERMLIYGGSSPEDGAFDDVYVLHIPIDDIDAPLRWERANCSGSEVPEARELHVASFLSPTSVLFSGGRNLDGNVCTDMALLDVETWQWQLIPICEWNRCSHAAATVNDVIVSFGGFDGGAIRDDCWVYADDEETWLRVCVEAEPTDKRASEPETKENDIEERFGHCGCAVELPLASGSSRDKQVQGMLVFGGMNAQRDLNDLVLITPVIE